MSTGPSQSQFYQRFLANSSSQLTGTVLRTMSDNNITDNNIEPTAEQVVAEPESTREMLLHRKALLAVALTIACLNGAIFAINPIAVACLMIDILRTSSLGVRHPSRAPTWAEVLALYLLLVALSLVLCLVVDSAAEPCRR
jgi:hypothetical protein